jgi:hypothetical protein
MRIDPAISCVIGLCVAALFATAAAHKLGAWRDFFATVSNYRLLPDVLVPLAAAVLIALEFAAAVLILPAETRSIGALLSAGLLVLYALAIAANLLRGRVDLDCGCLAMSRRQPVRWWMVGRNLLLAALSLVGNLPLAARMLTSLDALTIAGAALSLALLYAAHSHLSTVRPLRR